MTTKLTISRIAKTITPITKLPPMMKPAKASMILPAASVPSCPWVRISRVDAMLRARRTIVESSKMVGNALNSSGLSTKRPVSRMSTEKVIENARLMSRSQRGSGRIRTTRMVTTPRARRISPWRIEETIRRPRSETDKDGAAAAVSATVIATGSAS
jgi:hypothetical protein